MRPKIKQQSTERLIKYSKSGFTTITHFSSNLWIKMMRKMQHVSSSF